MSKNSKTPINFVSYDEYQLKRLRKTIYIIMSFGIMAFLVFAYFDVKKTPGLTETILLLRGLSCIPLIVIVYFLYTNKCDKYIRNCILLMGSIPMFIIMYMHTIIEGEIYFVPLTSSYFLLVIFSLSALYSKLQLFLSISLGLILSNTVVFYFASDAKLFLIELFYKSIGIYIFSLVVTFKIRDIELESYLLAKELHNKSLVDPLTQTYNRLGLGAWFESVNQDRGLRISLFMLDIDNFKLVNDVHGHQTGDLVIKDFAKILKKKTPNSSCIVRYGGEEFVVVIKNLNSSETLNWANSILNQIQKFEFCSTQNVIFNVTTSIGVAHNKLSIEGGFEKLIHVADKNLYKAKQSGRNKVVF